MNKTCTVLRTNNIDKTFSSVFFSSSSSPVGYTTTGNHYSTPGGTNSNSGSSYHCKYKKRLFFERRRRRQRRSLPLSRFVCVYVGLFFFFFGAFCISNFSLVLLNSLPLCFDVDDLTSTFVCMQTRIRMVRITIPTTTVLPTTTLELDTLSTLLHPNKYVHGR